MRKFVATAISAGAAIGVVLTPISASAATAHVHALAGSGTSTTTPPAGASGGDPDTTMTFAVGSGELTMTAPAAANFGSGLPGTVLTGHLGNVEVFDNRAADGESWIVTASETDFVNDTNHADTIPASAATYDPGAITTTGTITATGHPITLSNGAQPVVTGANGSGDNTATWNPLITITLPASAVQGGYHGTLTQSVS